MPFRRPASISINLGTFQKGRFTFGNVTLNDAILFAYDLPSKEMLVGRDGRKFKDAVETPVPTVQVRGRIDHKRTPMRLLVSLLSRFEQQLVVDQTGLDGVLRVFPGARSPEPGARFLGYHSCFHQQPESETAAHPCLTQTC